MRSFTRKEINANLRKKIKDKKPIIVAGAGIGIIAKMADQAGIDLLMAYCTGPYRMNGNVTSIGYMGFGDCNQISVDIGNKMLDRVENTPLLAGIGVADPYRDIDSLLEEMIDLGYSGVTNVPTVGGHDGAMRNILEKHGVGFNGEVELIARCDRKDIFSAAYAFDEEQTKAMAAAGVDAVGAHVGGTSGGSNGWKKTLSIDEAIEKVNRLYDAAVSENPDVLVFCHGGPFAAPEPVQECFNRTKAQGFIGASTIERIPTEKAIYNIVRDFTSLRLS